MLNYLKQFTIGIVTALILTSPAPVFAKPKTSKATIDPSIPIVSAVSQICSAGAGLRTQVVGIAKNGRAQAQAIGLQLLEVGSSLEQVAASIKDIPSTVPIVIDSFNQCVNSSKQLAALKKMPKDLDKIARDAKKNAKGAWEQGKGVGKKIRGAAEQCGALIEGRVGGAPGKFTSCLMGPKGMNIEATEKEGDALGESFKSIGPQVGMQFGDSFGKMGSGFGQCTNEGGPAFSKMFEGFTDGMNSVFANFGVCSGAVLMDLNPFDKLENAMSDFEDLAGDVQMTPGALEEAINSCISEAAEEVWKSINPKEKLKNLGAELRGLGQVLRDSLDNSFGAVEKLFPSAAKLKTIEKNFKDSCNELKKQTAKSAKK